MRNKEYADSTENDLIIVAGIGTIKNLSPFMRTLRTTGSKCGVVLLTDDDAFIDPVTLELSENCGLQIYRCGKFNPPPDHYYAPHGYVYYLIHAFLKKNVNNIGRVIILDLFDVVFQGDPFNIQVNDQYINVVDEGHTFYQSPINIHWYGFANWREWPKVPLSKLFDYYLCSGYFGGSAKDILNLITIFVNIYDYSTSAPDQGVFNYIFFGKGKEYGLKRSPFRKFELVHHIYNCRKCRKIPRGVIGRIPQRGNMKDYASLVHHYYKSKPLMASILYACPRLPGQLNYLGRQSENDLKNLQKEFPAENLNV